MTENRRKTDQPDSKRSRRRVLYVVVVAAVAVAFAFGAAGAALWLTSSRTTDVTEATAQIQKERARNIRSSCEAQNERHDSTIDTLNRVVLERLTREHVPVAVPPREVKIRLAAAMKLADPPVRTQIQQSIGSTSLLIDALAPRRDCDELVRLQVNTK